MVLTTRRPRMRLGVAALIAACCALAGCGTAEPAHTDHTGPRVVAATSWEAAFATAAGATDVHVIVPDSITHAPDYDPKPSDLAAVAQADVVLYARFEGFAGKLEEAAGSSARTLAVELDNDRDNVVAEVRRLGDLFGTRPAADAWLYAFTSEYDRLAAEVKAAWRGGRPPTAVAQTFVGFAARLSGAQVLATYGPAPLTARQVADLTAAKPDLVLANEQMDTAAVLPDSAARQVGIGNYPTEGHDLLSVYRTAASELVDALKS